MRNFIGDYITNQILWNILWAEEIQTIRNLVKHISLLQALNNKLEHLVKKLNTLEISSLKF